MSVRNPIASQRDGTGRDGTGRDGTGRDGTGRGYSFHSLDIMKTIDLEALPSYTKLELAIHQLDRAILLLLDSGDCISAITLAGAAEEILGNMVKLHGGVSAHQELVDECMSLSQRRPDNEAKPSDYNEIFTYYRNELKHLRKGSDITVTEECAHPILDRAIENLRRLNAPETLAVQRYRNLRWS